MDGQGPAHTRGVGTSDTSKNWLKRCCTCAKTACSRNQCRCFAAHRCCNRNCYSGCNNKTIGQQKVGLAVIEATNKRMAKYNKTRDMRGCSCQATGCAGKSCGCAAGGGRCTSLCSCRDYLNGDVRDAVYTLLKEAVAACATHRSGAVSVRHVVQKMKQRISSRRRGGSREEQRRRKKRGKTNCVFRAEGVFYLLQFVN